MYERHIRPAIVQDLGLVVPVDAEKVDCDVGVLGAERLEGGRELVSE
jgi:hypothetical protein